MIRRYDLSHCSRSRSSRRSAWRQQPIGTVGVQDATVAGALEVTNGRAMLVGSTTVTAKDHTAEIALSAEAKCESARPADCTHRRQEPHRTPAADARARSRSHRGSDGRHHQRRRHDPRPALRRCARNGPLDLRLRVTRNGDTCVENRGANAPALQRRRPVRRSDLRAPAPASMCSSNMAA